MAEVYLPGVGLDPNVTCSSSFWVTYRLIVRDAFWNYTPSMLDVVRNLTLDEAGMHNKVYDGGWPESILVLSSNSTR